MIEGKRMEKRRIVIRSQKLSGVVRSVGITEKSVEI